MKRSLGTDYIHWKGLHLSGKLLIEFEAYKTKHRSLLNVWRHRNPRIANLPPIYYKVKSSEWVWCDIREDNVDDYIWTCEVYESEKTGELQ